MVEKRFQPDYIVGKVTYGDMTVVYYFKDLFPEIQNILNVVEDNFIKHENEKEE